MKKILFAMMACMALFAFTACEKTDSQTMRQAAIRVRKWFMN